MMYVWLTKTLKPSHERHNMSRNDDSTSVAATVAGLVAVVFLVCGAGWGIRACILAQDASLGKAEEKVRRQNFEESESYRAGLRRNFDELMLQYASAKSDDERAAVLSVLRHRVEGAPPDAIPPDVKAFLKEHTK